MSPESTIRFRGSVSTGSQQPVSDPAQLQARAARRHQMVRKRCPVRAERTGERIPSAGTGGIVDHAQHRVAGEAPAGRNARWQAETGRQRSSRRRRSHPARRTAPRRPAERRQPRARGSGQHVGIQAARFPGARRDPADLPETFRSGTWWSFACLGAERRSRAARPDTGACGPAANSDRRARTRLVEQRAAMPRSLRITNPKRCRPRSNASGERRTRSRRPRPPAKAPAPHPPRVIVGRSSAQQLLDDGARRQRWLVPERTLRPRRSWRRPAPHRAAGVSTSATSKAA